MSAFQRVQLCYGKTFSRKNCEKSTNAWKTKEVYCDERPYLREVRNYKFESMKDIIMSFDKSKLSKINREKQLAKS